MGTFRYLLVVGLGAFVAMAIALQVLGAVNAAFARVNAEFDQVRP